MPLFPEDLHRRAIIVIPAEQFARLLDLPDGLVCHGIHADVARRSLVLDVVDHKGGTLEPIEPGTIAPEFPPVGEMTRETYSVPQADGTSKLYVRFGWEEPDDVDKILAGYRADIDREIARWKEAHPGEKYRVKMRRYWEWDTFDVLSEEEYLEEMV
jgi:hypothetical protein